MRDEPVLVTGATGYVGGRLVPRLLAAGHRVRALARSLDKLACRPWARHPRVELVKADVLDLASLHRACQGCRAAYYLVHSMNPGNRDFVRTDQAAALHMAAAAEMSSLERIIYLGGLAPHGAGLSKHLASRAEVGRILGAGRVPVTWLRAAMLLGAGSASFELMRYLVDRLPVLLTPRWVRTRCQPIAIENALGYLEGCLEDPRVLGQTFDIGGPQIMTYAQMFQVYARLAGLRPRLIVPVPLLSIRLSAFWISLITPVPAALAQPLAAGLKNEVIVQNHRLEEIVPQRLLPVEEAIARALDRIAQEKVETCWHDAGEVTPPEWVYCQDAAWAGGTILQSGHRARVAARPADLWPLVARVGGGTGYYWGDYLWRLRGVLDNLAGGAGLRRGRRNPRELGPGDALDFWRVLEADPPRRLVLLAEMKMPGQAVLEFRLAPAGERETEVSLIARFLPRGLAGIPYWYAHLPVHAVLYRGMLRGLAQAAGRPLTAPPRSFAPTEGAACRFQ
ncbi:MAG: SDR family oxidoreductase [Deltaproteobacteria bacterium]|nr:SDR family oxidoreductase [Deltaproteobacteria bacterium]